MKLRPPGFIEAFLPLARRRLVFTRLARRHAGRALHFLDGAGKLLLLTRDTVNRSHWRVTWFDEERGPCGHAGAATHREGVELAAALGARPESCGVVDGWAP